MQTRNLFKYAAITLLSGWLLVFVLLPNLLVLLTSFLSRHESDFVAFELTFANYLRLVDPLYLKIFAHSLLLSLGATLLCLLAGYPFALFLVRLSPGLQRILLLLVIIPFWTNSLVRTYAIRSLLAVKGPLNRLLLELGLIDEPLRLLYTGSAVTVGLVYVLLPFMIMPLYSSLEKLDLTQLEAAADLGAGRFQTLTRVVIPQTMPGIIAGCLMVFLPALGMFYVADLLGGAKDLLIGNLIKNQFLDARDWPFGASLSMIMTLLMAVLLVAHTLSRRRVHQEAL